MACVCDWKFEPTSVSVPQTLPDLYYLVLNTSEFSGVFRGGNAHFFGPGFGASLSQTTSTARSGNSFWNASVREFMVPEISSP